MTKENLMMIYREEGSNVYSDDFPSPTCAKRYVIPFPTTKLVEEILDFYRSEKKYTYGHLPKGTLVEVKEVDLHHMTDDEFEEYKFLKEVA